MIEIKIKGIIREINKDAWNQSEWCYVKLQTLLETVVDCFLAKNGVRVDENGLKAKLDKVDEIIGRDLSVFYELNKKANDLKHNYKTTVYFDRIFLREYADEYNYLVQTLLSRSTLFMIDSGIFDDNSLNVEGNRENRDTKLKPQIISTVLAGTINTGTSEQDFGFHIHCIKGENEIDEYEKSIYATIYNFMQRNNVAEKNKFICECENNLGHTIDYSKVFRYQMMLLTLIRLNCVKSGILRLNVPIDERSNVKIACDNINHYATNLSMLCKKNPPILAVEFKYDGIGFSLEKNHNEIYCYITNQNKRTDNKRDIWFASNLVYSVDVDSDHNQVKILLEFLNDFFGYKTFRDGQIEAIVNVLNAKNRSICIMPTGAGKSLVYYIGALLSACPTIVITPTKVLAVDQQRNLNKLHNINDCKIYSSDENEVFELTNGMIFLTPEDLQRHDVILNVIHYNAKGQIANVVLDEIHTLCNWSHDFRPDYLMLCYNLFTFVDRCRYIGFTATANYKVLNDLSIQLRVEKENVIQPIVFDAGDFEFEYIKCRNEQQQIRELLRVIETFIHLRKYPDDRMIVFTHNVTESNNLQEVLASLDNYDASCFDAEHTYSYQEFISGRKHVLIADSEMGIGINLPNIVHAVHYGLPNSKAQYTQEIGRANRTMNSGKSTVIFVGDEFLSDEESRLISFETSIDEVINIVKIFDTDLSKVCKTIIGSTENYSVSASHIVSIYNKLKTVDNYKLFNFKKTNNNSKINIQKYLYKLHLMGIVDNWYFRDENDDSLSIQVEVDFMKNDMDYIKEKTIGYLNLMGKFDKYTYEISKSDKVEEIIYCFEEWFYDEFLRYHREQLLNVIEFFNHYAGNNNAKRIKTELQNYFTTTLKTVDGLKSYIDEISQEELITSSVAVNSEINTIAEELLNQEYNQKYDLICYLYNVQRGNIDSVSRLLRVIDNSTEVDRRNLLEYIYIYYESMRTQDKVALVNKLSDYYSEREIIDSIYRRVSADEIYYGYLAQRANLAFIGGKDV